MRKLKSNKLKNLKLNRFFNVSNSITVILKTVDTIAMKREGVENNGKGN